MIKSINPFALLLLAGLGSAALCSACTQKMQAFPEKAQALSAESAGTFSHSSQMERYEVPVNGTFDVLEVAGPFSIVYRPTAASDAPLRVKATAADHERLEVRCANGKLMLRLDCENDYRPQRTIEVEIERPMPVAISLAGGEQFRVDGAVSQERLEVKIAGSCAMSLPSLKLKSLQASVAGSGKVEVDEAEVDHLEVNVAGSGAVSVSSLQGDKAKAAVAGSGKVRLSGECRAAVLEVAGSGRITADGLSAQSAEAGVAGSGEVTCRAEESLSARVKGSGIVRYAGNPEDLSAEGRVRSL